MHQIRFDWGSTPDPAGGAYICSVPPDHLDLSGSTSKGKEKEQRGRNVGRQRREAEGREGRRRGGKERV